MKYAIIKNVPLSTLIEAKKRGSIEWEKYGFCRFQIIQHSREDRAVQGHVAYDLDTKKGTGDFLTIVPIKNEVIFEKMLPNLQHKIDTNGIENDSIECRDEDDPVFVSYRESVKNAQLAAAI